MTPAMSMRTLVAQTTTTITEEPSVERVEPGRPFTDWLVDALDLQPDSLPARLVESVVEPAIQIIVVFAIAWVVNRLLRKVTRYLVDRYKKASPGPLSTVERSLTKTPTTPASTRRSQRAEALAAVLNSVVAVIVWSIALLVILGVTFGISLAPFLAGAGILGVALGFGAQDLVKDFLSGIFMLIEDQYGVGDVVDVGEANGVVEDVSLRTTSLRDVTGTLWHVPNGEIRRVGNMSQEWSRALLDIGVAYDTDIDRASELIRSVADEMAHEDDYRDLFLADPEVWGVEELAADSILIRLVIKTQPGEQWAIARELRRRLKVTLDAADIEIPFPQRTVWFCSDGSTEGEQPPVSKLSDAGAATGKAAPEEGAEETAVEEPVTAATDDERGRSV